MTNNATPESALASLFHAGNVCPYCQEPVATGQMIITCPQCGSIHHDTCWINKKGCSSYHCDTAVRKETASVRPDFVISADELVNVYVPPPAPKRNPQEVAASFKPKPPIRSSRLAIGSLAAALASLLGGVGALTGSVGIMAAGVIAALAAITLGVISMIFINNAENRLSGMKFAGIGIVLPAILLVVYFALIGGLMDRNAFNHRSNIKISENRPTEAQINNMQTPAGNAMRANVVIKSGGVFSETRYGSGVVARMSENVALIFTNKHVIGSAKKGAIKVIFYNGEESDADIEWSAPEGVDIAVLTCKVLTLEKYMPIKISNKLAGVGEKVFAVGNPMGLAWSYTEGTISSLRTGEESSNSVDLYQTQTPINSGNSGGGLYTSAGVLIGVNTLTQDKSVSEGLNFAIALPGILKMMGEGLRAKFSVESGNAADEKPKQTTSF